MNASRWERVQTLFHLAADLPEADRRAYVEAECTDDPSIANEVLSMLDEDRRASSVLDRDVSHLARAMLDAPTAPVLPTEQFGPYHVTSVLGEGGMGVVYLAERSDLGSTAAIKILRDAWLSPARRERFAAEQRTLAQLNHPSIARLYDADTLADGTPWFVMEYVEGKPLTAYCDTHASGIRERLVLFREVCEAVQHAHRHAIIHRDLKPSNILVTTDGSVKLLDFGIAKQLESLEGADITRTGLRPMTPAYAAPEQVQAGRLGMHTDVYSLGRRTVRAVGGPPAVRPRGDVAAGARAADRRAGARAAIGRGASYAGVADRDLAGTVREQAAMGRSRRVVHDRDAQGSSTPLRLGGGARTRRRSLPDR